MQVIIPLSLINTKQTIEELTLMMDRNVKNSSKSLFSLKITTDHIQEAIKQGYINVDVESNIWDQAERVFYNIVRKNGLNLRYKFPKKTFILFGNSEFNDTGQNIIHVKKSNNREDNDFSRKEIFEELNEKITNTNLLQIDNIGVKNLIYYTIFFDNGYVNLLNQSIMSILDKKFEEFDLLLITDEKTKNIILSQPFITKKFPQFLIVDTPKTGVAASQYKTKIYSFPNINDYNKILFLDCDIICLKDLKNIFNLDLKNNILYTAKNINLKYKHHKSYHHGFEMLGDAHVEEMTQVQQMPFNAGQFLFKNSTKMRSHFENLNWFMQEWVGEFFFEQCFMNYYFCKAIATNDLLFHNHVALVSTVSNLRATITEDTYLIHFVAPPCDAYTKLKFIENFQKELNNNK